VFCVTVEADGQILDLLERMRWLREADAHDVSKVAEAIRACLLLSAKV
jgi:hypothetical protein